MDASMRAWAWAHCLGGMRVGCMGVGCLGMERIAWAWVRNLASSVMQW